MLRSEIISNDKITDSDVIVGLSSYGMATYENEYNGGMGSNGLTSARHDVFAHYLASKYPESFENALSSDLVYSGNYRLTDAIAGLNIDAGKLVLSPTRTYAPVILKMLQEFRPHIHGMVHCSGGAQTKVMNFVENLHITKDNLFPVPPLFKIIQEQSKTSWQEMYKVFNMGHRFEIYTSAGIADQLIAVSKSFGVDAQVVGRCERAENNKLTIKSEFGEFIY
jgi:phosphoribosylformylglycinamidine cyclo-ligase